MSTTVQEGTEGRSRAEVVWIALRAGVLFIVLCGLVYPLVSTGLAQLVFPHQANGSLLKDSDGRIVGSELIGQSFSADPGAFHGRVSSIDYMAEASGSNNFAPSNPDLIARMEASIADWQANNPDIPVSELPIALITNSGSGLDPHITPQSAFVQIPRISKVTGIPEVELASLVNEHTEKREWGIFGETRVNVLKLNLAMIEKQRA
ncbi:potassium-transporting ATPase subunit KdpC [Paenibacillus pinisoli]|uniref:Potassium-transporting ATPase KdpC subunit n=1 Tax=Paenibacillus pinisoli TaxID=1276110 RepID=A0A3A6PN73_9BACL|nr:potassium-transporting ATPase subunit KdpC [Paenibacillus pinisoli]RJX37473.1 potassium-transporting ATPase subunit KdpC [Paenibacillus pinisoli]